MAQSIAKLRQWRSVYEEFQASGLSVKEFCVEKKINYYTFKGWQLQFAKEDKGAFIEVGILPSSTGYAVQLRNGRELRFSGGFSEARVRQLIRVCEDA